MDSKSDKEYYVLCDQTGTPLKTNGNVVSSSEDHSYDDYSMESKIEYLETDFEDNGCTDVVEESNPLGEKCRWTHECTKLFISLYDKYHENERFKKNLWKKIRNEMYEAGFFYTEQQIENKWKSLERAFRNRKVGRTCAYQDELFEILVKSSNPKAAKYLRLQSDEFRESKVFKCEDTSTHYNESGESTLSLILETLKKSEREKVKRHDEKMKFRIERNKLLREKNIINKQKNLILQQILQNLKQT